MNHGKNAAAHPAQAPSLLHDGHPVPASFSRGTAWHVVMTNIKCEFRAKLGLAAKGFAVYLPIEKRIVRHARRKETRVMPLFRRYVFVAFDPERDEWYEPIRTTDGIIDLLSYPSVIPGSRNVIPVPLRIADAEIEGLQRRERAGDFDYTNPASTFAAGDAVRIANGAMCGLHAVVRATPPNKRIEILLDLLGRKTIVKLDAGEIEKI